MSQPTQCPHIASGEGVLRSPFEPPAYRAPTGLAQERSALPPLHLGGALMAERRTVRLWVRVSPTELAACQAKASAAGLPVSALLRQAMARTRTWTAAAADIQRERNLQVARIGNNLNQIARWANTHAAAAEAVTVIANLVSFERSLVAVVRSGGEVDDAH